MSSGFGGVGGPKTTFRSHCSFWQTLLLCCCTVLVTALSTRAALHRSSCSALSAGSAAKGIAPVPSELRQFDCKLLHVTHVWFCRCTPTNRDIHPSTLPKRSGQCTATNPASPCSAALWGQPHRALARPRRWLGCSCGTSLCTQGGCLG